MRLLGQILLVALVIAALQGLVAVLVIAIVLLLIWGLLFRTAQTVGLIILGLLLTALQVHPWLTISAGLLLAGALLIGRVKDPPDDDDQPPLIALPPPDDETR